MSEKSWSLKRERYMKENEKDLVDMPKKITDDIKITPVENDACGKKMWS